MSTLTKAVETFLKSAKDWLLPEDSPATVSLQLLAQQIDTEPTPALWGQFGLAYRSLLKKKPAAGTEDGDELDDLIPDS